MNVKIKLSEFDEAFVERIKKSFQGQGDVELTISFSSTPEYFKVLDHSIKDLEETNGLISFTMEELEAYTRSRRT